MMLKNSNPTVLVAISEEQFTEFQNTLLRLEDALNKKEKTDEGILTVEKAIEFFGCSRNTLYNWKKKGYLKSQVIGGRVYFKKADCLKALEDASPENKGGRRNG